MNMSAIRSRLRSGEVTERKQVGDIESMVSGQDRSGSGESDLEEL